jgi:hypothetical protein
MVSRMRGQGMYRHKRNDIIDILRRDIQSISIILNRQKFMFNNMQPNTVISCYLQ